MSSYTKTEGCEVDIQQLIIFLCMSNEQVGFDIKCNTIYMRTPNMKHLGMSIICRRKITKL